MSLLKRLEENLSVPATGSDRSFLDRLEASSEELREQELAARDSRIPDFSTEKHKGIQELKNLPRDMARIVDRKIDDFLEHPVRSALSLGTRNPFNPLAGSTWDILERGASDIAAMAGKDEALRIISGEKVLSDEELLALPPEERREAVRRQSSTLGNLGRDLVELKGLATLPVAAATGVANIGPRYSQARERGESVPSSVWESTVGARDFGASLLAKLVKSVTKSVVDPAQAGHDGPLEHVGNLSMGLVGPAGKVREAARPSAVYSRVLDDVATQHPSTTGILQMMGDSTAGIREASGVLNTLEATSRGTLLRRLDDIDPIQKGIKKTERAQLVRELGGERVKDAVPGIVEKRYQLSDDIASLQKTVPYESLQEALRNPSLLDNLRQSHLKKTDRLAETVESSRLYTDVDFVLDGVPLNSVEFLVHRGPVDPSKLTVSVREGADPVIAAQAEQVLLPIRKVLTEIGEEAVRLDMGLNRRTQSVHAGTYFPERRGSAVPDAEIGAYLEQVLPAVTGDELGAFNRATLKHTAPQSLRTLSGSLAPEKGHIALVDFVTKVSQGEAKLKTYQMLANRFSRDVVDGVTKKGVTTTPDGKKWVRVPDSLVEGHSVPRYGALAGKYIEAPLWSRVKIAEKGIGRYWKRFSNTWKASKVTQNPPSHFNQAAGNILGNVIEGSTPVDFGAAAKSLRNKDDLYRAARDAGIIGTETQTGIDLTRRLPKNVATDPVGAFGKLADNVLTIHEKVVLDNQVGQAMAGFFQLSDNLSKLTHTNRHVRKRAKELGISQKEALKRPEVLQEARQMIESTWHPTYSEVPKVIQVMDEYNVMPFARYSYRMTANVIDSHVTHPYKMSGIHQGERARYDTATELEQEAMDIQPHMLMGRGVQIGDSTLNTRWSNPLPLPEEILGLGRGGSYGSPLYNKALGMVFDDIVPKGLLLGLPFELLTGESLEFQKDITKEQEILGVEVSGRLDYVLQQLGPGWYYHAVKKLYPAIEGKTDFRGRKLSATEAALHALGIRLEETDVQKARRDYEEGAAAAADDAYSTYRDDLVRAGNDIKKQRAAKKKYEKTISEIEKMKNRYLNSVLR